MKRRNFLALLGALPFLGCIKSKSTKWGFIPDRPAKPGACVAHDISEEISIQPGEFIMMYDVDGVPTMEHFKIGKVENYVVEVPIKTSGEHQIPSGRSEDHSA